MTVNVNVVIIASLVGLFAALMTHIVVIARWTGRVDMSLEQILQQPARWTSDMTQMGMSIRSENAANVASVRAELAIYVEETKKLREGRHVADGTIQRHEGRFQAYDRFVERCEKWMDEREGPRA